jgi:hypothetical protein
MNEYLKPTEEALSPAAMKALEVCTKAKIAEHVAAVDALLKNFKEQQELAQSRNS